MFSRQHYITFAWVLLVVLVVLNLLERSAVRLKLAISSLFLPLFGIVGAGQGVSDHLSTSLATRNKLLTENERLRRENQELRAQSIQTEGVVQENARLRQVVGWQKRLAGQPRLV